MIPDKEVRRQQDAAELERADKQIAEIRKRGDALIAESAALRKETRAIMGIEDKTDRQTDLLEKKI